MIACQILQLVQSLLCSHQYRGYIPCNIQQLSNEHLGFWQAFWLYPRAVKYIGLSHTSTFTRKCQNGCPTQQTPKMVIHQLTISIILSGRHSVEDVVYGVLNDLLLNPLHHLETSREAEHLVPDFL